MILSYKSDVRPQPKSLLENSPALAVCPQRAWKAPTSHLQECPPGFDAAGAGAFLPGGDLGARRDSGCLCSPINSPPWAENRLLNQPQDLIDGQGEDAEHRMAYHPGMAAHANHAPAKLVFQARVNPLHGAAFPIAQILGVAGIQQLAPFLLGLQLRLLSASRRGWASMIGIWP